jgi:hypothetical protein
MEPLSVQDAIKVTQSLSNELIYRRPAIDARLNYFRGTTGTLKYASEKFGEYFSRRFSGFSDNWCMPVAQAAAERMNYTGFRLWGENKGFDLELARVWEANDGDRGSSEAFLVFGAASRAYALVSPGDGVTPRITWEHPSQTIVDTDPQTGERRSALVVWVDDKMDYATLYTPEWIYKFQRETGEERFLNYDRDGRYYDRAVLGGWSPRMVNGELAQPEVNPLGVVPVVELRNQTLLDDSPISDIQGVMAMQDSINLVWAYLLNALDSASLPQRVVTGADVPQVPILDSNGQQIGTRPVELDKLHGEAILWLPDDAAKIAEWSVAQLDAFGSVIERGVEHIAAQTRTPPHYLVAKMVNTAAESLTIAEAGLVSKTRERIRYVNPAIREVNRLVALCQGADERRIGAIASGQNLWGDVQYRSEAQMADAMLKMKQVGFPFEYIAERYGLQPDDIQRVLEMRKAELASDPLAAAQAAMQMPIGGNAA